MGNTAWCKCGKCIPMPTRDESCCCTEIQDVAHYFEGDVICITTVDDMLDMCMEENRLDFIRCSCRYSRAAYSRDRNRILRKASYQAFSTWAHSYLELGNRIPIPSCMVDLIRKKFPDNQQHYVGFFWSSDYPAIDMAFDF
ncbi:P2X purinoceptor 7-like [Xenopus laevis]|nr:P2X purinoceptor 7-like [Xenopus laevis]